MKKGCGKASDIYYTSGVRLIHDLTSKNSTYKRVSPNQTKPRKTKLKPFVFPITVIVDISYPV